jgi:hypothetical protein
MAGLDDTNIAEEYRRQYPPLITVEQAAEISCRKVQTIYDWSSRGLLDSSKVKRGGRLLLRRDAFVRFILDDTSVDASRLP